MEKNPFEPPAAEVAVPEVSRNRPFAVPLMTALIMAFTLAAGLRAVVYGTLPQAAVAVFFCAFVSFVPAGLWLGRPWAPPVSVALGGLVVVLAFGSLLLADGPLDQATLVFRVVAGTFGMVIAALAFALRRHRYFATVVLPESR